jgi:UDP-glucose 4-epimerase
MRVQGKRFLAIGGAGFVGSHLVDQLLQRGAQHVRVFDNFVRGTRDNLAPAVKSGKVEVVHGSITDAEELHKAVAGVDGVFHFAALWLGECLNDPRAAMEVNVGGTFNVAEVCRKAGIQRLVFSSSASVYGDAVQLPMTETHPFNNRTMYGATKIAGEQILRSFNEMYKLNYVGLRYMNVYGPRMDDKGTYVSVIVKVLDRIERGLPPLIFGDGSQTYDFVHVSDVARANLLAMEAATSDRLYNVGCGKGTTINELVRILLELRGSNARPEYKPEGQTFVTQRVGSTDLARTDLGFEARMPLREGLDTVVRWWDATHQRANIAGV